jgi:two-component system, chemotaxis family, response regulator Rcp1
MSTQAGSPVEILIVEDNEGDVRLARESLRESKIRNTIHHVPDGVEAMDFLHRQGRYAQAPRPDLILLDLNMPRMDGREVLAAIKSDADLKRIPVVILTVSNDEIDIFKTYNLHANCFITKPIDLDQFIQVVKSIEDFWLTIVKLPSGHGQGVS